MKNFTFILALLLMAVPACAYQVGQANRTNFNATQQGEQPQNNYRAFSNYNSRNWSRGVQTQTVQTEVAGTSAVDFDKNTPQKLVAKTQAASQAPAKAAKPQPAAVNNAAPVAQAPENVDPAAMLQQVQGMVNAMGTMSGGTNKPGQAAAGQNAPAMPAGMPDISALMGGAAMPAAPAGSPAKK